MSSHLDDPRSTGPGGAPAVLAGMRRTAARLAETLWAARDAAELMETITHIEALKSTLDAVALGVLRELDATGAVKPAGWASTQDFLTAVAGGHKGSGPAALRLAKAVDEPLLAPLTQALTDGWLSTAKAHVIARAVDTLPGNVEVRERGVRFLLTEAKALDASELTTLTRHLLTVVDPTGEHRREEQALDRLERTAHLHRHLSITGDLCGGAWIKGRCSTEDAALIKSTLLPLAAPHPNTGPICHPDACTTPGCSHDGRDPRDHGARMLDALVEACHRLHTTDLLPETHGAVPRLSLLINLHDLREQSGHATTDTGEQLSAAAIRRIACDSHLIPTVLGTASEVLDVGRQHRLITPPIWKALVARDRHCRFGGCTRPPLMCHAHHLTHWLDGGHTSLHNLILLCGHHHRLIHTGPWQIRHTTPNHYTFHPPPDTQRRPEHRPPDAPRH